MLEAVRVLGNSIESQQGSITNYLSIAKLQRTKIVLNIIIQNDSYNGISQEEKQDRKVESYLYSAGPSNGTDKTPTSLIVVPERTFERILKWFNKYSMKSPDISKIKDILNSNKDRIIEDIRKQIENLPKEKKANVLLTIKMREGTQEEYFCENQYIREILVSSFDSQKQSEKNNNTQLATISGKCFFCGQEKNIIKGRSPISDIFSFSTFDKKGFLYGFNESDGYKQLPVCNECYMDLRKGKEWYDRYAYFGFEGYKYYLIADVFEADLDSKGKAIQRHLTEFKENAKIYADTQVNKKTNRDKDSKKLTTYNSTLLRYENNLMNEETDLLQYITEKEIDFSLFFIFVSLKGGGKYIDVERYVQDVPITWIKKIFDAYRETLSNPAFNEENMRKILADKKWQGRLKDRTNEMYLAGLIKYFFPDNSNDIKFLDFITRLLSRTKIDTSILFRAFMRPIRSQIHKDWKQAKITGLKSLTLLLTLIRIELITDLSSNKSTLVAETAATDNHNEIGKRNYLNFEEIFDSDAKKAVFFEGVLAGKLMAIQYASRKSTPFIDKLHGLHISFKDAKTLLPQIIAKLREYQQAYAQIENETAQKFLLSEKLSRVLTNDETSYYFTLGMLLYSLA